MNNITFVYELYNEKEIEMTMIENPYQIEDCPEEKVVHLFLKNGEEYQGIFRGMDGDDIILKSLHGKGAIGINKGFVKEYLQEK